MVTGRLWFFAFLLLNPLHVSAFFRLSCQQALTIERADPIISPGKVASHTHIVSGGSGFSLSASGADLRASQCSSCLVKQDMSAYWSPMLYFQFANGSVSSVNNLNGGAVYYKLFTNPSDTVNITAFPDDFRLITGDAMNRNPNTIMSDKTAFVCMMSNGTVTQTPNIPAYDCDAGIRTTIVTPSCWNGKDTDSADHKSHVAWPTWDSGPCPTGFPVRVPQLRYEITFNTGDFSAIRNLGKNPSQPFVFANGDPTGYGYHMDFLNGWTDRKVLQAAIDQCKSESGLLEDCKPLALYDYSHKCQRTPDVNEAVTGLLPAGLPGCNPTNWGPAASTSCTASSTPALIANASQYNESAPPPSAIVTGNSPRVLMKYKNWSYKDCYTDGITTHSLNNGLSTANKSVEACLDACNAKGYGYCSIAYGGYMCLGGSAMSNISSPAGYGQCGRTCVDSPLEYCGSYSDGYMELYTQPPPTTTLATWGAWSYHSCWTNWQGGKPTLSQHLNPQNRTIQSCLAECDANGFSFCGMDGGDTCYGGIAVDYGNSMVESRLCDVQCADDSSHYCGGSGKLGIYVRPASTTVVPKSGNFSYTECHAGTLANGTATLGTQLSPVNKTIEACMNECEKSKFAWCGMQYFGNICLGGNTLSGGAANTGTCATYCQDAKSEWCGGYSSLSLYKRITAAALVASASSIRPSSSIAPSSSSSRPTSAPSSSSAKPSSSSSAKTTVSSKKP
ncbi:hypothetical protein T439DRAFT_328845 [Meredithblackwellia eburnea MCA 4105]